MCLLCGDLAGMPDAVGRARVVQLLHLLQHPDALPTGTALRLAGEILTLAAAQRAAFRCDPVAPGASVAAYTGGGRS